jgi:hypothetical protein
MNTSQKSLKFWAEEEIGKTVSRARFDKLAPLSQVEGKTQSTP